MRPGDIIAAIVMTLLAGVAFLMWATPGCACTPPRLNWGDRRPPVVDSAFLALEAAESTLFARRGRYARGMADLADAHVPRDVRIVSITATDSTWHVRFDVRMNDTRVGCVASGRRASADGAASRLAYCDSRIAVDSTHTTIVVPSR